MCARRSPEEQKQQVEEMCGRLERGSHGHQALDTLFFQIFFLFFSFLCEKPPHSMDCGFNFVAVLYHLACTITNDLV